MEILQILAIGVQTVFEPSLRNLPVRLSTPVGAFLSGKPNSFIIFQSSFGFPILSDSFSCKSFLFLSLIKTCTVSFASLYNISSTLNLDF